MFFEFEIFFASPKNKKWRGEDDASFNAAIVVAENVFLFEIYSVALLSLQKKIFYKLFIYFSFVFIFYIFKVFFLRHNL